MPEVFAPSVNLQLYISLTVKLFRKKKHSRSELITWTTRCPCTSGISSVAREVQDQPWKRRKSTALHDETTRHYQKSMLPHCQSFFISQMLLHPVSVHVNYQGKKKRNEILFDNKVLKYISSFLLKKFWNVRSNRTAGQLSDMWTRAINLPIH